MPTHAVRSGECLSTIAARYGLRWTDVWEHPKNAALRRKRTNPNVLAPGDEVFVPDVTPKQMQGGTGQVHKFVLRRDEVRLRLRLLASGEPIANAACTLEAEGFSVGGSTNGDGLLEVGVPPDLRRARLVIDGRPDAWLVEVGALPPPGTNEGARARLQNLGYDAGVGGGRALDEVMRGALSEFQRAHGAQPTAELDDATVHKLVEVHGC